MHKIKDIFLINTIYQDQYNEYWIESEKKYSQSFNFLGTYH